MARLKQREILSLLKIGKQAVVLLPEDIRAITNIKSFKFTLIFYLIRYFQGVNASDVSKVDRVSLIQHIEP